MYYLALHIIVFIWGFTGILGHKISLEAPQLVWYRMLIAFSALMLFNLVTRKRINVIFTHWQTLLPAALFVALHWIFFFGSIKASNINIGVVCMSTQAFMISLIQPLIKKTRTRPLEIILGLCVIAAMITIFGFEYQYRTGILMGLASSFFAVCFTLLNAKLTKTLPATVISGWEMGLGALIITIYLAASGGLEPTQLTLKGNDLYFLLILGIVCTAVAFAVSVEVMKKLSPYTVSLSVNLEPVYTILLALYYYPDTEIMSAGFYAGALILISTVVVDALISSKIIKINK